MAEEEIGKSVDRYLQYLDKEMSIMGILSTFTALSVGGIATILSTVGKDSKLWLACFWTSEGAFLAVGGVMVLLSSLFFYTQRSRLAWCYGQLALTLQNTQIIDKSTDYWLHRADSWGIWQFYRYAFLCLFAGAVEFGCVVTHQLGEVGRATGKLRLIELAGPPIFAAVSGAFVALAFSSFPNEDDPYQALFSRVFGHKRSHTETTPMAKPGRQWKK
jgi:predicted permease